MQAGGGIWLKEPIVKPCILHELEHVEFLFHWLLVAREIVDIALSKLPGTWEMTPNHPSGRNVPLQCDARVFMHIIVFS